MCLQDLVRAYIGKAQQRDVPGKLQFRLTEYDLSIKNLLRFCSNLDANYRLMFNISCARYLKVMSAHSAAYQFCQFWIRRKQMEEEKAANLQRMKQLQLLRQEARQYHQDP